MAKKASSSKRRQAPTNSTESRSVQKLGQQLGYDEILSGMKQLIADSRYRAAATVNRELVCLYWNIGRVIVQQQETANWGDAVVERLAKDLRMAFPEMKGLSRDNVFRMRQFFTSCRELDRWFVENVAGSEIVGTLSRQIPFMPENVLADELAKIVTGLSWSHHYILIGAVSDPAARYFYMQMSVRERWSVRELRRQIDAALYQRYMESKRHPEKCMPADAECGDLLPFKDHYVLEFLGLEDEHSEKQLRKAILANLRDFFLEFGKELTFVGEEYPITIGGETFHIDLLFYQRRLQCLVAVDLKKGRFKPEYVGKSQFYVAALDEQVRLPHDSRHALSPQRGTR